MENNGDNAINIYSDVDNSDSECSSSSSEAGELEYAGNQTLRRTYLSEDAKQICLNVYNNLIKDPEFKSHNTALQKAAFLTGIPYPTMCRIVRTGVRERKTRKDAGKSKELGIDTAKLLRGIVYNKYQNNEVPTIEMIHKTLSEMEKPYSETTLRRYLKKLGFKFRVINKRASVMESRRIVNWRIEYLEKIQKFREDSRHIYYLDETWYDTHDTAKKGWSDESSRCQLKDAAPNRGSRMIISHCGSKDGWVKDGLKLCGKKIEDCNVDYHKNMQSNIFEKWFEEDILPNLKPNSVIVMDNAPYHSKAT